MFQKITQIKEYLRLKKEYKIKEKEWDYLCLDECIARGKIRREKKSVEGIVVHSIDKGFFGSYNYPCIVEKLGWDRDMMPIIDPDKTFYCPGYKENEPCKNSKCMHYLANQAYFIAKGKSDQAWEELKKIRLAGDEARIRAFGRAK